MKKIFPLLMLALLLAGGGWYWWLKNDDGTQNASSAATRPPQAVAVLELKPQRITFTQQLPGRVSPYRQSQVRPQVDGIITERLFEEGADVEKGQQLYQIDDARYKAALNSAKADLASARANVKPLKPAQNATKSLSKSMR